MTTVTFSIDQADLNEMIRLSPVIGGNVLGEVFRKAVRAYLYPPKRDGQVELRMETWSALHRLAEQTQKTKQVLIEEAIGEYLKRRQFGVGNDKQEAGDNLNLNEWPSGIRPLPTEERLRIIEDGLAWRWDGELAKIRKRLDALEEYRDRNIQPAVDASRKDSTPKEWRVVIVPGFDNPGKPRSYNLEGHIKEEAASGWTIVSVLAPSDSIDQWIVVCR